VKPSLTKEIKGEARIKEAKGGFIFINLRYDLVFILHFLLIDHLVFTSYHCVHLINDKFDSFLHRSD
jgi:hypothetical protein